MENEIVNIGIVVAYVLIGLAIISAVLLPLINAISDPKTLLKGALGVVFLVVIFGIAYSISSNAVMPTYAKFGVGADLSKYVGGVLISMYLLLFLAIIGIIYTEISKLIS